MTKYFLPTLDRYLLRQLVPPFVVALTTMLIALLLERLLILFNHLANSGSSIATLVTLLTELLPHYMGLALPAALCIAVFLTVHRMSEHNEIDALCASHVSLLRITLPYTIVGLILGALSVLLYGYIQPVARYDYRAGFYFARHTGWAPHLQSGMFASTSKRTMITADRVSQGGSKLTHVFIKDEKPDGTVQIITAPQGVLTISEGTQSTQIDLWDGHIVVSKPPYTVGKYVTVTRFKHITRVIERGNKKLSFRSRGDDERELTMFELVHALYHGAKGISYKELRSELDFRLTRALAIPFIPLLSVALAISRKRKRSAIGQISLALILVGFDEVLLFGHSLAAKGSAPMWLSIWVPELIFCVGCVLILLSRSHPHWYRPKHRRIK